VRYFRWAVLLAAVTSALIAAGSLTAPSPSGATPNGPGVIHAPVTVLAAHAPAREAAVRAHRARTWTVRPGQTLSTIARAAYGSAKLWPALWWVNKRAVPNPDLITPGTVLRLSSWHPQATWLYRAGKAADGPVRLSAPSRAIHAAARHARAHGRIWKVTYGYPYKCGDGDGDGYDMPCSALHRAHRTAHRATHRAHRASRSYARSYAGRYSYAGLRALWMAAGGPSWAASHAASIAMCESGGNVYAHNPSGATGLFQILGQVVGGNLYNPYTNAANAVAKFRASGGNFSAWVCR
jgi:hypothetical protein